MPVHPILAVKLALLFFANDIARKSVRREGVKAKVNIENFIKKSLLALRKHIFPLEARRISSLAISRDALGRSLSFTIDADATREEEERRWNIKFI